jgi:pimeloyl-ACP methyl ester carboxylesterase
MAQSFRAGARTGAAALTLLLALALPVGTAAKPHHAHKHKRGHRKHVADGKLNDWIGAPTNLGGRSQLSKGELIYTDYLYDDYGPDLDHVPGYPQFRDQLAPKSGDYGYPDDPARYGYNAADLRELRLAADKKALHGLVSLQTMKVPDAAIVTIAIDSDGNPQTGQGRWPDGAGLYTQGADQFIVLRGGQGRIEDSAGQGQPIRTAVNTDANAIEFDAPRKKLGPISNNAKIWIGVGLQATDGGYMQIKQDATAVFDLGFQGAETYGLDSQWGDQRQSAALANGDVTAPSASDTLPQFAQKLDIAAMKKRKTSLFQITPGFYNRIFRSAHSYGEGIDLKSDSGASGTAAPEFLGPYQPYGLYIPKGYDPKQKTPLLLDGHSLDVNHDEYASVSPNQFRDLGDARGSIIITPLARGMDTWYLDAGLVDVLEAWNDAKKAYNTDPDRTSITGYSMGGYMTYRLGLLMPDAFARAAVYVGPPAYSFWPYPAPIQSTPDWLVPGNTNQIVDNGLDLPYEVTDGNADELVPIAGVVNQVNTFKDAGNPYRFYDHAADDHFSFILSDINWNHTRDWLGVPAATRNLSQQRVRYKRYPSMDLPQDGLVFDGAYWVDKMVVRDTPVADSFGEVDATTFGHGGQPQKLVEDPPGVLPPAETGLSPAVITGQHYEDGGALPRQNAFSAKLTNLSSLLFDTGLMGIEPGRPVTGSLDGDGPVTLRFRGRWPKRVLATLDGQKVKARRFKKSLSVGVNLAAGATHTLTIRRAPGGGASHPAHSHHG